MKYLLSFFFIISVVTNSSGQALTDSLIFLYNFEGNANDSWQNGLNATNHGATLDEDRNGIPNSAYVFDGVDDYLEIPSSPLIQVDYPVSFSFWLYSFSLQSTNQKFFRTEEEAFNYHGYWMNGPGQDGQLAVSFGGGNGTTDPGNRRSLISDSTITDSTWHHVVGIIRGPLDMDIYIDCVNAEGYYDGSGSHTVAHTSATGRIANRLELFGFGIEFFHGKMDQLAMWNRALTVDDITKICQDDLEHVSIEENEGPRVLLYPNPTDGFITLSGLDMSSTVQVEIHDNLGRSLISTQVSGSTAQLNLEALAPGVYYLSVRSDQNIWSSKIQKF